MIDQFSSEYGWDIAKIIGYTKFQLDSLANQIEERRAVERHIQADIFRVGQHADRSEYERFIESLYPESHEGDVASFSAVREPRTMGGFEYTKET